VNGALIPAAAIALISSLRVLLKNLSLKILSVVIKSLMKSPPNSPQEPPTPSQTTPNSTTVKETF